MSNTYFITHKISIKCATELWIEVQSHVKDINTGVALNQASSHQSSHKL